MVMHKRKKNTRHRGTKSHGYGAKKKHRGAGHRGGRGLEGSGKRGDAKKPRYWKRAYFGKVGFIKKNVRLVAREINIKTLEDTLPMYVSRKAVEEKDGAFIIDLSKLGYTKLLSAGTPTKKMQITTLSASRQAIEKISKHGGSVNVLAPTSQAKLEGEADQ